jgi:calcineurin-like phosphoesterase family protein
MKFFTSDLHFSHKSIVEFCPQRIEFFNLNKFDVQKAIFNKLMWKKTKNQKFKNIYDLLIKPIMDDMNAKIIEKINLYVKPGDTLYIIGDSSFCNINETAAMMWLKMSRLKLEIIEYY